MHTTWCSCRKRSPKSISRGDRNKANKPFVHQRLAMSVAAMLALQHSSVFSVSAPNTHTSPHLRPPSLAAEPSRSPLSKPLLKRSGSLPKSATESKSVVFDKNVEVRDYETQPFDYREGGPCRSLQIETPRRGSLLLNARVVYLSTRRTGVSRIV